MSSPDGAPVTTRDFVERLWPGPGVWAVVVLLTLLCALVGSPYGTPFTLAGAVVGAAASTGLLIVWTPIVAVRHGQLLAGRAHVPVEMLGTVTVLDQAAMQHEQGPGLDARAYLCTRGWVRAGVRVELIDPADPTPYWLISSRQPQLLVAALEAARRSSPGS